ncbi:hypothetical protein J3R30DRAFT_3695651 [Lentinula aciculospora]|uniref:Uncharacterized protein n=1 Tax=Lentinula aciculospora TaxID=153920 RepID=A0A9W9DVI9_9AGAR|nr:hypothetical protein J3R30DRAFT_3695651 [Lentinula aciculospora]
MLPNSSRAMPGGLPSGPRSRSTGPSRQQNAGRSDLRTGSAIPPSRHVRPQKSLASLSSELTRTRTPQSSPPTSSESSRNWQRKYTPQSPQSPSSYRSTTSRTSQDSTSTTSSVSSIFDRVKNGAASYASSYTSVDDSGNEVDIEDSRGRSLRKQRALSPEPMLAPEKVDTERTDIGIGDGYTVWNRVAAAASTLTVSVSKAWAANVSMYPGEETPPGQESKLTRAMKAYHIEKARDPSELPAFLFTEHERQPRTSRVEKNVRGASGPGQESGVRVRHATGSTFTLDQSINRSTAPNNASNNTKLSQQGQKGTDRLKALREARRPQAITSSDVHVTAEQVASRPPKPRIGLPSTPGPRRR